MLNSTQKKNSIISGCVAVLLAAGEGVRMRSSLPKVLHAVGGRPMIVWGIEALLTTGIGSICVVVGSKRDKLEDFLKTQKFFKKLSFAVQKEQRGSAHALMQAVPFLKKSKASRCLVMCGDTPLIESGTLVRLISEHRSAGAHATVLAARFPDPYGYGRIKRDENGSVLGIIEERDASPDDRLIREGNAGIYVFDTASLVNALKDIRPNNVKNEYYLTDALDIMRSQGGLIHAVTIDEHEQVSGINNRIQLSSVELLIRRKIVNELMISGVTVIDPSSVYIEKGVKIGNDSVILPGVMISGNTRIGKQCVIGPYAVIDNAIIGDRVAVRSSYVSDSRIKTGITMGPFACVRPKSAFAAIKKNQRSYV